MRIALVGSYNARQFATAEQGGSSGTVGIGIVGQMVVGGTSDIPAKDQRFVNLYPEVIQNHLAGKQTVRLVKRPGFTAHETPQSGSIGNAIMVWTGQGAGTKVISAFGGTNSSIYDGTTRLVTNHSDTTIITGRATGITETSLNNVATLVISSSDNTGWYYQPAGTVTKITNAAFPGNAGLILAGSFVHIDSYAAIATTDGRLWNSNPNSVTVWTLIGHLSFSSYPDAGVAAVRWRDFIVGFGTASMEFFKNTGNPAGSPFTRVESMATRIGCVNANSITDIDGTLYWIGTSKGSLSVYSMASGVERISPPEVDAQMLLLGASNLSMTSLKFNGRSFVLCSSNTRTFAYCVESKAWHEWAGPALLWHRCAGVSAGATLATYAISLTDTSGKTFVVNPASFTYKDNGAIYNAFVRTGIVDMDTSKPKKWKRMRLVGNQNATASNVQVRWSDDDYQSFSAPRNLDISRKNPTLYRMGRARRRAFLFEHAADAPWTVEAMELDVKETA